MAFAIPPGHSRYIRTTSLMTAEVELPLPFGGHVRFISRQEASAIAEAVRKRNVFSRHSWENNFYLRRANELADATVIELFRPGDPAEISDEAASFADTLEKLLVSSTALASNRHTLQLQLGLAPRSPLSIDFVIGPGFRYLRSTKPRTSHKHGVAIDGRFLRRYQRCGFPALAEVLLSDSAMANRLASAIDWLYQSRMDPSLHAAITKTATALETLLIISESEGLAHTLSERAALILSQDPPTRALISSVVKGFYDARSSVVHGNAKKLRKLKPSLVEAVDRLVLLLSLRLAANLGCWPSPDAMRQWCETERWGPPTSTLVTPFPKAYLRDALAMADSGRH